MLVDFAIGAAVGLFCFLTAKSPIRNPLLSTEPLALPKLGTREIGGIMLCLVLILPSDNINVGAIPK